MAYLVTFETDSERERKIVDAVKALGEWGTITRNSYLLNSKAQLPAIVEMIQPMLGPKDSLAVLTVSSPWAGYCDPIVEEMMDRLLGKGGNYIPKDWNGVDRS